MSLKKGFHCTCTCIYLPHLRFPSLRGTSSGPEMARVCLSQYRGQAVGAGVPHRPPEEPAPQPTGLRLLPLHARQQPLQRQEHPQHHQGELRGGDRAKPRLPEQPAVSSVMIISGYMYMYVRTCSLAPRATTMVWGWDYNVPHSTSLMTEHTGCYYC